MDKPATEGDILFWSNIIIYWITRPHSWSLIFLVLAAIILVCNLSSRYGHV